MKKVLIIISVLVVCSPLFLFDINTAIADPFDIFKQGLEGTGSEAGYNIGEEGMSDAVINKIGMAVQVALSLVGVAFFGLTIYGGYLWMLARGNEEDLKKAQETLRGAVIGLIIVISAYAITYFFLYKLGSETLQPAL